jgi:hypothetical protein
MQLAFPRTRSSQLIAGCVLLIGMLSLTACQPVHPVASETSNGAAQQIPEVTIEVNDSAINIPADFPGGIVAVTVHNNTSAPLDVGFTRMREGTTIAEIEELSKDFMGNLVPLLQKASFMLSFNPVPAGESKQAIMDFKAGQYLVDATAHSEEMPAADAARVFAEFNVDKIAGTTEPQADVKVEMQDFAYVMPDEIKTGELLWEFQNQGQQWHMALFVKPKPGVSMDEVIAALQTEGEPSGPLPFEFVEDAGVPPISEGERVWVKFDLSPGEYLVLCPIPDVTTMTAGGQPMSHFQHGMQHLLTVK